MYRTPHHHLGTAIFGLMVAVSTVLRPVPAAFAQASDQNSAQLDLASPASVEDALNIWERRLSQEGLIVLGYYNGFADGTFGQNSRTAIASYQRDHKRSATGRLSAADTLELSGAALDVRKQLQWQPLTNSRTGITMSYPTALLTKRQDNKFGGETLETGDGAISLKTLRFPNSGAGQLDTLFQNLSSEAGSTVTYQLRRPNWFILSGNSGDRQFYARFEQKGDEVRGYDLSWLSDKSSKVPEKVSVLISNGFHPFGDNSNAGEETLPTLLKLAKLADAGGKSPQPNNGGSAEASSTTNADQSANNQDGVMEQKAGALAPPKDGSLVTSDGKGLRFVYHYFPPKNPGLRYAYQWTVDTHLFPNIPEVDALDGLFVTSHQLHYVARECGTVNAFYDRSTNAVFLCYEMIDSLTKMGQALSKGASDPKALTIEFVRDNLRFILLHESGHALIDQLDLPAVGREEDSVDQLAAVMLLSHVENDESKNDIARVLQLASVWFKVSSQEAGNPDVAAFADEHSLDAQRYFNLLCLVYGLDPDHNGGIVSKGMLPKERADRCPAEATKVNRSWARLLLPHFAQRFQPNNASSGGNSQPPPGQAPANGNPLEWDRKSNPLGN